MTTLIVVLATIAAPFVGCGLGWLVTRNGDTPVAVDPWDTFYAVDHDTLDVDDRY